MGKNLTEIAITRNGKAISLNKRGMASRVTAAKQSWELNGAETVTMTIESVSPITFEIGDELCIFNRDYRLNRLPKVSKSGALEFTYDLEFEGVQYDLMRVMYDVNINTTNNELQDIQGESLTGDLQRFMAVLVANANRVFPGKWALGKCPSTASDVTMTFGEDDNCLSVLQTLCNEDNFNVEFEIVTVDGVYTINIYNKVGQVLGYVFKYGRGNGLYKLTRQNVTSSNIVTRLKVFGGTENITSKYRADRLCLPGKTKSQSYIQDDEAVAKYGIFEGRKNFDDIKPTYTGTITAVDEDSILVFYDSNFPFDLNETDDEGNTKYLISDVSAKIHFNSGNLAGYEFEVSSYDHATKKFTIIKQTDERGNTFPSSTSTAFQMSVGNAYKILDIAYPDDITEKAENELLEAGTEYYKQNCQPKVQYGLSITQSWLEDKVSLNDGIVNIFAPGDYVTIEDSDIGVDKSIRIKSFTRNALDPYDYTLTISDTQKGATIQSRILSTLIEYDKIIEMNNLNNPAKARSNWLTSRELLNMIFDVEGNYYTDKIAPASIDTMMLSVGAKSMQFILTGTKFQPNYNGDPSRMAWVGGTLTHYAISDSIRMWQMRNGATTNLDSTKPYYIYAQCPKSSAIGTFIVTTDQRTVDSATNYYLFMVGVLNSVDSDMGVRSIALTYGFTTINGRYLKTGCIESSGGADSYLDLDTGAMQLGDKLYFNTDGDGKLILKGTLVQSQSGDVYPMGCYRGTYTPGVTYYQGDTVAYNNGDGTSIYMCITQCTDVAPTDTDYWTVYASQGTNGADGAQGVPGPPGVPGINGVSPNTAFKSTVFYRSNTMPSTPTGGSYDSPIPTTAGWSDGIPSGEAKLWASTRIFSSDGESPQQSEWTTPQQMTDTADFDVEFSSVESPDPPDGHPNTNTQWGNESDETTIWMATSKKNNGVWKDWQISKIKGESGEDGTSIAIKGEALAHYDSVDDCEAALAQYTSDLDASGAMGIVALSRLCANRIVIVDDTDDTDCATKKASIAVMRKSSTYITGGSSGSTDTDVYAFRWTYSNCSENDTYNVDGTLWVAQPTSKWVNAGNFQGVAGKDGTNGKNAFVHIKYANSLTENDWTDNNGETPGAYIGIYSDNNSADQLVWALYTWSRFQGEDGFGYEYIYKRTTDYTAPSTPTDAAVQTDDYVPSGWTDNPTGVSESYPYEWVCYRKRTDGTWGQFRGSSADTTKAALWAKFGSDGATGDYYEFRYAANGSTTVAPSLTTTTRNPSGWTVTQPTLTSAQYLWLTFAKIDGESETLLQNWSTPVRVSGTKGDKGDKGDAGDSPAMVFRGEYSAAKTYYGSSVRIDCVKYNDAYYVARIDAPGGSFSGKLPTNTDYWNQFGASFESVATDLLLAENANIAGWVFRDGILYSQDGTCYLNGETGDIVTNGLVLKKMVHITADNADDYATEQTNNGSTIKSIDFYKAGSLLMVDSLPSDISMPCLFPSLSPTYGTYTEAEANEVRKYIGTTIMVYCNCSSGLALTGTFAMMRNTIQSDGTVLYSEPASFNSFALSKGQWAKFECKIRRSIQVINLVTTDTGREEIYWQVTRGTF